MQSANFDVHNLSAASVQCNRVGGGEGQDQSAHKKENFYYTIRTVDKWPKRESGWQNEEENDNDHSSCCVVDGLNSVV